MSRHFRCTLQQRPGPDKEPVVENFKCEECEPPSALEEGHILIQTLYLSLDPALRCRMNLDTGVEYMRSWSIGETVLGLGGVGVVRESRTAAFQSGDIVESYFNWPWITCFNWNPSNKEMDLKKVDTALVGDTPQLVLSVFGITGLTAYLGLVERSHVTPGANQTFVVSAAAGACGNLAGQIAALLGFSKVVGICGDDNKCSDLVNKFKFTHAINYKTEDVAQRLKETCPEGIHCYYDNVGGSISETVIKQMVDNSDVILVGQIAVYNKDLPYPPPISEELEQIIKERNINRERFLVVTFASKFADGLKQLAALVSQDKLKVPEFLHEGLETAPLAFVNQLTGREQNKVGKQMIHVADV